jgi:hypothetical protein
MACDGKRAGSDVLDRTCECMASKWHSVCDMRMHCNGIQSGALVFGLQIAVAINQSGMVEGINHRLYPEVVS